MDGARYQFLAGARFSLDKNGGIRGATRATCSSADSRAGLLPMSCSNLRGSRSWSADPNLATAAKEDLLAEPATHLYLGA